MVKCPKCGTQNPDEILWCKNCDTKIIDVIESDKNMYIDEYEKLLPYNKMNYEYNNYYKKKAIKIFTILVFFIIIFSVLLVYFNVTKGSDFSGINCKINEDFWFEEDKIITDDGWKFKIEKVKDYTLNGVVLGMKQYSRHDTPYDPCDIFSPADLLIGVDNVKENPEKYDYSITSFDNRIVCWYLKYNNVGDYHYFKSHTGNNHLIPHNEEVLEMFKNISLKDNVLIQGSLVNLYGTRGQDRFVWTTDTYIGNYDCEIILVDELIIE